MYFFIYILIYEINGLCRSGRSGEQVRQQMWLTHCCPNRGIQKERSSTALRSGFYASKRTRPIGRTPLLWCLCSAVRPPLLMTGESRLGQPSPSAPASQLLPQVVQQPVLGVLTVCSLAISSAQRPRFQGTRCPSQSFSRGRFVCSTGCRVQTTS